MKYSWNSDIRKVYWNGYLVEIVINLFTRTLCEMRAIASKNTNQIYNLASKLSDSMLPFFFVKKNEHVSMADLSNFTLKVK